MLNWVVPSPAHRRLLPDQSGRPTAWVVAIMMFVTLVVAAAGLAIANGARTVGSAAEGRYSVQLADGARSVAAVVAAARSTPGVVAVTPVPEAEVRATLERWLGAAAAGDADLPIPVLIELDLAPLARPALIEASIQRVAPDARLLAYRDQLGPVLSSLEALQWLALGMVLLMMIATGASVVLATRGSFNTHRGAVEVMHGIGATDGQLAALFQRRLALDAFIGSSIGSALAAVVLLLVAAAPDNLLGDLAGGPLLRPADLALLAMLPFVATVLATVVARITVIKALRAAP